MLVLAADAGKLSYDREMQIFPILMTVFASPFVFSFEGGLRLFCQSSPLEPLVFSSLPSSQKKVDDSINRMTAQLSGPYSGVYVFELTEFFDGQQFKNRYDLKLDSKKNLSSPKATLRDLGRDPKGHLQIEFTSPEFIGLRLSCP